MVNHPLIYYLSVTDKDYKNTHFVINLAQINGQTKLSPPLWKELVQAKLQKGNRELAFDPPVTAAMLPRYLCQKLLLPLVCCLFMW